MLSLQVGRVKITCIVEMVGAGQGHRAGHDRGAAQVGICANTPAAKGRVERAHLTLQDRLVKEFRLAGISSIHGLLLVSQA